MFGKPAHKDIAKSGIGKNDIAKPEAARVSAADRARIQGGGLVQAIVTSMEPLELRLFLNDQEVPQTDIGSLSVSIEAPPGETPTVRATLAYYASGVTGAKTEQRRDLFPCTLEVVALGRRISITCTRRDSLDGLWIDLGLRADGTSNEVNGARSLTLLITQGVVDAFITWDDGVREELLPR